jgi:hypothetical protein
MRHAAPRKPSWLTKTAAIGALAAGSLLTVTQAHAASHHTASNTAQEGAAAAAAAEAQAVAEKRAAAAAAMQASIRSRR